METWSTIDSSRNESFTVLLDAVPSRFFMFLLLGQPSQNGLFIESYLIRVFDLRSGAFSNVPDTKTKYLSTLHLEVSLFMSLVIHSPSMESMKMGYFFGNIDLIQRQ